MALSMSAAGSGASRACLVAALAMVSGSAIADRDRPDPSLRGLALDPLDAYAEYEGLWGTAAAATASYPRRHTNFASYASWEISPRRSACRAVAVLPQLVPITEFSTRQGRRVADAQGNMDRSRIRKIPQWTHKLSVLHAVGKVARNGGLRIGRCAERPRPTGSWLASGLGGPAIASAMGPGWRDSPAGGSTVVGDGPVPYRAESPKHPTRDGTSPPLQQDAKKMDYAVCSMQRAWQTGRTNTAFASQAPPTACQCVRDCLRRVGQQVCVSNRTGVCVSNRTGENASTATSE